MKLFAIFAFFCVLAYASISAVSAYDEPSYDLKPIEESESRVLLDDTFIRERRQHIPCNARWSQILCRMRCARRGGGYCHGRTCVCNG